MIKKLVPVLLALFGLAGGVGAGLTLKPAPAEDAAQRETTAVGEHAAAPEGEAKGGTEPAADASPAADHSATQAPPETAEGETPLFDYVKLNNQFVIPVVKDGQVASMVILALSLEVTVGGSEQVYLLEPKLRDVLLQVMFDHANSGGFSGDFTQSTNMVVLRDALREAAIKTLGSMVSEVLIIDIARQDL